MRLCARLLEERSNTVLKRRQLKTYLKYKCMVLFSNKGVCLIGLAVVLLLRGDAKIVVEFGFVFPLSVQLKRFLNRKKLLNWPKQTVSRDES